MLAYLEAEENNVVSLQLLSRPDRIWKHCAKVGITRSLFSTTIRSFQSAIEISPAD